MTCQWCIYFRYKHKESVCVRPGGDGRTMPSKGRTHDCTCFSPRHNCTTCEYRCSLEERKSLGGDGRMCGRWTIRKISKWGGKRVSSVSANPSSVTNNEV